MNDLNRRNTEGAMQAIRRMEATVAEQQIALNIFSDLVGRLIERVNALETAEAARKIAAMGRGPTVKE
jgi:uncharacterized coiled-coil protein SlyX